LKKWLKSVSGKNFLFGLLKLAAAVIIALIAAIIIIAVASDNPGRSIDIFLRAPFASEYVLARILTESVPLIFTGVAVCIMVRCGQFNMIGEGTFFAGALIGAVLSAALKLPAVILPLVSMLIAGVISGVIGYIPAKLKSSLNVNELVSSLMLNFVIFWVCMYLFAQKFADPDFSSLATPTMPDGGRLPYLSEDNELSSSFLVALIVAALAAVFLFKTKWGYAIRMTGGNPGFARYAGINTKSAVVYSQVLGAGIAGFGGAAFMMGNFYRFSWKALPNYGFDGFIVAIMAKNNPLLVPFAAIFMGYLRTGAMEMARLSDVPNEIIYIIQAIMIIIIGADAFLGFIKNRMIRKSALRGRAAKGEQNA
jgi:simple sugar transport system permease protein